MTTKMPAAELPLEPLYEGDRGPAVAQLQTRLTELNFYGSEITNLFDAATKQAVRAFQAEYGLTEEAGFFGPKTWYAITFWSKETGLSNASSEPATETLAIKQRLRRLVDAAAVQPEPLMKNALEPRAEVESGKILFWPFARPFAKPFANKSEGAF
ncbi:MAG: peptidoglycan-binding protein [Phormidesmis sp.]